jgi:hypothetical protein
MADDEYCKIYDAEDTFTGIVQVFLAVIALGSLYVKRQHEFPRRKFMTWWLDVSKQGCGAIYSHLANMLVSAIISGYTRGDYELKDQCAWYGINFLIDSTIGLFFSIVMLNALTQYANKKNWASLKHCGVYEGKDGMKHWTAQLITWMLIMTVTKFILVFILWVFYPILARVGDFLFKPLQENIRYELLFVMIIFPGVLNFFYFWIADQYLKAAPEQTEAFETPQIEYTLSNYVKMSSNPSTSSRTLEII